MARVIPFQPRRPNRTHESGQQSSIHFGYNRPRVSTQTATIAQSGEPFLVGEWLVEPSLNRLSRGEVTIQLELKAMDVLLCLVEHAGDLVSKHILLDSVWQTEFVSDNTLTNRIAQLRGAFGDDAQNPRYIETIRKRGYRLIAEVGAVAMAADSTPSLPKARSQSVPDLAHNLRSVTPNHAVPMVAPTKVPPTPSVLERRLTTMWAALAAMAVIATVVGLAVWAPWRTASQPVTGFESRWVAVAPLENRTGDASLDVLGQRAGDLITQRFSEVGRSANVVTADAVPHPPGGENTSEEPRKEDSTLRSVGEKGPHILVSGSYYLDGENVEFHARLTDYNSGEPLHAFAPITTHRSDPAKALENLRERVVAAVGRTGTRRSTSES